MSALSRFGALYRDEHGHEVWRIVDADGRIVAEGVESDHDAAFIAEGVAA